MRSLLVAFGALFLLVSCSTERQYAIPHEKLVDAATRAVMEEAYVKREQVQRVDADEKGGKLTVLTAPYNQYSRVECKIDTRGEKCNDPELQVRIVSNDVLYTRHKEWEWRIHELALKKLRAQPHGPESLPTALPAKKPTFPNTPPPASNPIYVPPPVPSEKKQ